MRFGLVVAFLAALSPARAYGSALSHHCNDEARRETLLHQLSRQSGLFGACITAEEILECMCDGGNDKNAIDVLALSRAGFGSDGPLLARFGSISFNLCLEQINCANFGWRIVPTLVFVASVRKASSCTSQQHATTCNPRGNTLVQPSAARHMNLMSLLQVDSPTVLVRSHSVSDLLDAMLDRTASY